jgi:hypothetical protein
MAQSKESQAEYNRNYWLANKEALTVKRAMRTAAKTPTQLQQERDSARERSRRNRQRVRELAEQLTAAFHELKPNAAHMITLAKAARIAARNVEQEARDPVDNREGATQ